MLDFEHPPFEHPPVAFRLVVVDGDRQVVREGQHLVLAEPQALQEVAHRRLFHAESGWIVAVVPPRRRVWVADRPAGTARAPVQAGCMGYAVRSAMLYSAQRGIDGDVCAQEVGSRSIRSSSPSPVPLPFPLSLIASALIFAGALAMLWPALMHWRHAGRLAPDRPRRVVVAWRSLPYSAESRGLSRQDTSMGVSGPSHRPIVQHPKPPPPADRAPDA